MKVYRDTPEQSLELKVKKLEARRDHLRERMEAGTATGYCIGEMNALDVAVALIEEHWEEACQLIERRRNARF